MVSPKVAVDVVIFTIDDGELQALVVQVKRGPFAERWAFPGGLVPVGEAPEATATRELLAQTGLRDVYLEQLRTFGDPARDPQAHVLSVAYFALVPHKGEAQRAEAQRAETQRAEARRAKAPGAARHGAGGKYARVQWAPVRALPQLAYDHNAMAAYAWQRLKAKLGYTNIVYSLLPREFTLSELQEIYEIILGRRLDRRNFRKKVGTLGLLRPLQRHRRGRHRPAQLYTFTRRAPMNVEML